MSRSKSGTDKYSAPALSKGLDILEFLASEPEAMRKADIARALDRSVSEIFRMLVVLEEREYVAFDKHRERYSLTTKLFEVAHRYPPIRRLSTVAAAPMQTLAMAVNQSVHLAVRHDTHILVIAQVDSPGNNVILVRLGARIPLVQTASGAVLCSELSAEQKLSLEQKLQAEPLARQRLFRRNCAMAARQNYCECKSMVIDGVINLSAPIRDHAGQVIAALTIPFVKRLGRVDLPSRAETAKALRDSSESISRLLGGCLS